MKERRCECGEGRRYLDEPVQAVQAPLEGLTVQRDVTPQVGGSSPTENRPPAIVELQQVHRRVSLLLLQLFLISQHKQQLVSFERASFMNIRLTPPTWEEPVIAATSSTGSRTATSVANAASSYVTFSPA